MNPPTSELSAITRSSSDTRTSRLIATYRVTCAPEEVERVGQEIAFEQTVEVPPSLVTSQEILEGIVGSIESIDPDSLYEDAFLISIGYSRESSGAQIPQLLNLVYGNISMKSGIALVDLEFPESYLSKFLGPRFGIEGVRQRLGVYGRPLLATALKPQGASTKELAARASDFVRGGGDIVKDDHNLHDRSIEDYRERVGRCLDAVRGCNRNSLYLPNLCVPVDQLDDHLAVLEDLGVDGALIAPWLLGLDTVRALSSRSSLILLAHPTLTGSYFASPRQGIDSGLMLGTFMRLAGCDGSIFPNAGGRFSLSREECARISTRLGGPLPGVKAAWPVPAGGMKFENLFSMSERFSQDSIFLIGGGLLGYSNDLEESTRRFIDRIEELYPARYAPPALANEPLSEPEFASACEFSPGSKGNLQQKLQLLVDPASTKEPFQWEGRTPAVYKRDHALPFRGISRHELIGQHGEQTSFDLRYFEIEPGGHSSLEKHAHTHTIIVARGQGALKCGEETFVLGTLDIAYVPPMMVHQLTNSSPLPFGFFCIVDHERDAPQSP